MIYTVVVGNIGTVFSGRSEVLARREFDGYVTASRLVYGRTAGEPVTLLEDGEIVAEYIGTLQEHGE